MTCRNLRRQEAGDRKDSTARLRRVGSPASGTGSCGRLIMTLWGMLDLDRVRRRRKAFECAGNSGLRCGQYVLGLPTGFEADRDGDRIFAGGDRNEGWIPLRMGQGDSEAGRDTQ